MFLCSSRFYSSKIENFSFLLALRIETNRHLFYFLNRERGHFLVRGEEQFEVFYEDLGGN